MHDAGAFPEASEQGGPGLEQYPYRAVVAGSATAAECLKLLRRDVKEAAQEPDMVVLWMEATASLKKLASHAA
eukprot:2010556-Pyramimonas_sp.AAC.1